MAGRTSFSALTLIRTTAKATLNHYRPAWWRADHALKAGVQVERGEHHSPVVIPTGVRYTDRNGPFSATFGDPSNSGGVFITTGVVRDDAITVGDRLTINAGLRFDHSRAISQDLPARRSRGKTTDDHHSRRRNALRVEHPLAPPRADHEAGRQTDGRCCAPATDDSVRAC